MITVVTACYNGGIYLDDAYNSLELNKYGSDFEYIIVDDGSTDRYTLDKLEELKQRGVIIIQQENKGLAAARNAGVAKAKGEYIIPLDCDNKLVPEVIIKAAGILKENPELAVVYTDVFFFENEEGRRTIGSFDKVRLLHRNYIDACALVRKDVLEKAGGYDGNMPAMGHEDWEIWINIALNGGKFYYLNEIGFHYRRLLNSMSAAFTMDRINKSREYIFIKHSQHISSYYAELFAQYASYKRRVDNMQSYVRNYRVKAIVKIVLGMLKV